MNTQSDQTTEYSENALPSLIRQRPKEGEYATQRWGINE